MGQDDVKQVKKLLSAKKEEIDKTIEKYVPKQYTKDNIEETLGEPRYSYNIEAVNAAIAEPAWEFMGRGGKRWRPALFLLIIEAFGEDPEEYMDYSVLVELLHNGSLIIDDIEDGSERRRGHPTLHRTHGTDLSINAGNSLYFLPFLTLMQNHDGLEPEIIVKAYEICLQELINIHFGQGMDLVWHKGLVNADEVTEKEYLQMCAYKTGTLARLSARLAALLAGASEEEIEAMGQYAESIGIGFQIQDDVLNLKEDSALAEGKDFGEDITEGKRSLPVIRTLHVADQEDRERLLDILDMHTRDEELIREAVDIIENYDSIEYSKERAEELIREGWELIDDVLPESEAKGKLESFARFLIERDV